MKKKNTESFVRADKAEQKEKQRIRRIAAAVLIVIAVCCSCYVAFYYHGLNQQEAQYEELRRAETETEEVVIEAEVAENTEDAKPVCEPLYDFDALREENGDIYAWITVPGTQVDYPVLQSGTDNYYLEHNLDGSSGYPGCIYTNDCNPKDFSDYNTVLYGHNMKNGSMFGCLHSFEEQEFFEENRTIVVYTEEKRLTYEICAAVKFTDVYIPAFYDTATMEGRDAFAEALREESEKSEVSHMNGEMELQEQDKLITLSTCVSGERSKRWLIVGRLAEEAFYSEEN